MRILDQYRNGDITLEELKEQVEKNPKLADEIKALTESEELSDDDLDGVAGGMNIMSVETDFHGW